MSVLIAALCMLGALVPHIAGHGMMLDPPNRSSLWRYDPSAPQNYDDNQNFCGGADHQWAAEGGQCGVCGDPFDAPHPQDNENTGKYGTGKVVRNYQAGAVINIQIELTANHKGFFLFSVCNLPNPNAPEPGESCFQAVNLANGQDRYNVDPEEKDIALQLKLPNGLTCDRCVLRWHYTAGNNWGECTDGTYADGCGPQETFRSCSDISIH